MLLWENLMAFFKSFKHILDPQQISPPSSYLSISGWFDTSPSLDSNPKTSDHSGHHRSSTPSASCAIVILLDNSNSMSILETHITTRPSFTFPHTLVSPQTFSGQNVSNYTHENKNDNYQNAEYLVLVHLVTIASLTGTSDVARNRLIDRNSTNRSEHQPICGLKLLNEYNSEQKSSFRMEYHTETLTNITIINSSKTLYVSYSTEYFLEKETVRVAFIQHTGS